MFNKFKKNGHHAPLKSSRGIAQPKGHASVGKSAIWTSEGGLFLILRVDRNLKES